MPLKYLLPVLVLTLPATAAAVSKCVTPSGDVIFTDMDCPTGSQHAQSIEYRSPPPTGLREGERAALERIEQREAEDRYNKQQSRQYDQRNTVSYGDRKRIRELEMKKVQLSKSLSRGSKTWDERRAIETQIIGLDRQIEQLQAPRW